MDYFDYDNHITPGKGKILLAEPFSEDPNFDRSVILLCEHNEDGSFGLILNKPIEIESMELIKDEVIQNLELNLGGPVQQNTFHYIHKNENISGSDDLGKGIYWGGDFEEIKELMEIGLYKQTDYKYFLGYSGWEEGQLEEEISKGSWIVAEKPDPFILFKTHPEDMWKIILKSLGGRFDIYSNYPSDPRLN